MLSVLIPVYNYDVTELVQSIHAQCTKLQIDFEILVIDDCSTQSEISSNNKHISSFANLTYCELTQNIGNAKARNLLYEKSKGKWLLFLDADTLPVHDDFIEKYIAEINNDSADLFSGGIEMRVEDLNKNSLRWKYGNTNEKQSGRKPNQNPALGIRGANFLIKRELYNPDLFMKLPYGYGYVDTVFGLNAQRAGYKIQLMDNPVYHLGLENAETFISKTEQAVNNALYLRKHHPQLAQEIKLVRAFDRIKKLGFQTILSKLFLKKQSKWKRNLLSDSPSLRIFQWYKIAYMSWAASEKMDNNLSS